MSDHLAPPPPTNKRLSWFSRLKSLSDALRTSEAPAPSPWQRALTGQAGLFVSLFVFLPVGDCHGNVLPPRCHVLTNLCFFIVVSSYCLLFLSTCFVFCFCFCFLFFVFVLICFSLWEFSKSFFLELFGTELDPGAAVHAERTGRALHCAKPRALPATSALFIFYIFRLL